jgi:hypothetical protein
MTSDKKEIITRDYKIPGSETRIPFSTHHHFPDYQKAGENSFEVSLTSHHPFQSHYD